MAPCFVMSMPNSFTGVARALCVSPVIAFCKFAYDVRRASCNCSGRVTGAGLPPWLAAQIGN